MRGEVVYCRRVPADSRAPSLHIGRAELGVGALAFLLRSIWVLAFAKLPGDGRVSDPLLYHEYGQRIAEGQGYMSYFAVGQSSWTFPTSYYPPGYPFFLGGIYKVVNFLGLERWTVGAVGLIQALLWALAAVAVALTARWAFGSSRAGIAAGVVLAVWPNLISYAGAWLSESLFVFLVAVGVAALTFTARCEADDRRSRWGTALTALAFGAATMVRPQVLLGLPFVAAAWLWAGIGWRRTVALAASVAVAVGAFIVPWAIRNQHALGSPVFVSTNGGDNLCIGFHPGALGGFAVNDYCETGEGRIDGPAAEVRRNSEARRLALEHIGEEPLSLPWLTVRKLFWTYRTDDDGLRGNESYGPDGLMGTPWRTLWVWVTAVGYAVIMFAAVAGVVLSWRSAWKKPRDPVVLSLYGLTLAGGFLVQMMFFGDPRFKVGTTPLFAAFAGLAVATLWTRVGRGDEPGEPAARPTRRVTRG